MPATTKSQYRLFSQVKGVQKWKNSGGKEGLSPDDLNPKYREEIEGMAKTIDPKEVDKMLSVDFDKLEESYDELDINENMAMATPGSVNGMGSVSMPGDPGTSAEFATQETGSGDLAATSALTDGSKKKKPKNEGEEIMKFMKFNAFVGEMKMHDRILPDVESIDENLGPDVKVGDKVVIQPPKGKTKSKGEVTFLEDDGKRNSRGFQTFYYKDRKGEEWAGSTLQIVSVNGKDNPDWGKT